MKLLCSLLAMLLLSTSAWSITQVEFDSAFKERLQSSSPLAKKWSLLANSGWHFKVKPFTSPRNSYKTRAGKPFAASSFAEILQSEKTLAILINENYSESDKKLLGKINGRLFDRLINKLQTYQGWRVKFSDKTKIAAKKTKQYVHWPKGDTDALGTGFDKFFNRTDKETSASWIIKEQHKPSDFFQEIMGEYLVGNRYSSGCLVAQNTLMSLTAFLTFDNSQVYDENFPALYINNNRARSSEDSFIEQSKADNYGQYYAHQGPQALIGQPGYLNAILIDGVLNEDYNGENIVITEISESAAAELAKKGLGNYKEVDDEGYELELQDWELKDAGFSGISRDIISWWTIFHKFHKPYFKQLVEDTAYYIMDDEGWSYEDAYAAAKVDSFVIKESAEFSIRMIETKDPVKEIGDEDEYNQYISICGEKQPNPCVAARESLDTPFFNETTLYGHPEGQKPLKKWIYKLATINPDTPFAFMFYDYDMQNTMWPKFMNAHLN